MQVIIKTRLSLVHFEINNFFEALIVLFQTKMYYF
jgi:hypothetical protein